MIDKNHISWTRLDADVESRIQAVYDSWIGTRYMHGQQAKGIFVDCVQLVGGILDELSKAKTSHVIPRLPIHMGLNSAKTGFRTCSALRKQFRSDVIRDGRIEPGDVIVTKSTLDSSAARVMGHVVLVGVDKGSLLHAAVDKGVCWTSIQAIPGIVRMYRIKGKELWA